jgi:hypothetical protein
MKKLYKAVEEQPNKWKKKASWKLNKTDIIGLVIFTSIAGYVAVRLIIG